MTSKQSDGSTEDCPATQPESPISIDGRLANLQCPFNWDLQITHGIEEEEIVSRRRAELFENVRDKQDYFHELGLICHLMQAFEATEKDELSYAMEEIAKAEECLVDIEQKGLLKNVENVLQHLFIATKCHVLKKLRQLTEVVELLERICDINYENETELAMLFGCRCSALSLYTTDNIEGTEYAKRAIKLDPNNGKWHFLLGQNFREVRRKTHFPCQFPNEKEASAFEEAYRLSPNVLFGVTLAQMYRERDNCTMANVIYKEVYALEPTSCTVRFQLALGFIRLGECVLAKECLDYIAKKMPDSIRYAHYMAIYEEKCNKDPKAALPYYKTTTENYNKVAEWQYMECRKTVEPDWDPLPYLLGLLEKYEKFADHVKQEINIQIGLYYVFEMHDILSACQYLTKAIEIQPKSKQLRVASPLFRKSQRLNIYRVLAKEVQFALSLGASIYDDDKITVLKNALELCPKNFMDSTPLSSSRAQPPRSQWSNSNRNYDRGSSSHVQSNWREERPSSSPKAFSQNYPLRRGNDGLNTPKRHFGSPNERDYTSWRSERRETQDSRNDYRVSNTFENKEDSASTNRPRDGDCQQNPFSRPRHENDGSQAEASHHLVKTVKDLNL